jgi:hypothetical protein
MCNWILNNAPVKSGSMKTHAIPFNTVKEFYEQYKKATEVEGRYPVRSLSFFF